jgi:TP901 family phage tail tape measure protein
MAEGKYSLKIAAQDAFSTTFADFGKKAGRMQEELKAQQAELRKLNSQIKDMKGYEKLGADLKKTEGSLASARAEQARLSREQSLASNKAAELSSAYGKAVIATKALESSTEASTVDLAYARAEQQRLGKELDSVTQASKKLDAQQDRTTASVKSLERTQRREREELIRLGSSLKTAGVDTSKLSEEQNRLKAATERVNAALTAQRAKLDAVKGAQGKVEANRAARGELRGQLAETAAVGYLASRPIDKAMKLETAMADVGKVINFAPGGREEMASQNLKLASDRLIASGGMGAVDLAKIEYAAGQSGIGNDVKGADGQVDQAGKQAAIMDFTRDAAIMASAFDISAQDAGETMAGWRASMALNRAQTLDLADSTNYLGNSFNATAADIASVVKRYGAVGKASGLTPEQTAALSAAFLNPGTEKEIAGTGFKNFTAALTKGEAATKGQKKVWKELGFDPEDLAADMQKDAPKTIMAVLNALKDQPVEEQAAKATQLFGSESIGAIQPLLQNLGEVQRAFDMVKDKTKYATSALGENGSMMQEAKGVADTSQTSWNVFKAKLERLTTLVGNAMLPALNAVLVPIGSLVDGLSWAAETFPGITGAIAVAGGALAALKVGALGLKFAGLLIGQAFNKGGLARAKLDARTAQTASMADRAVARLNAALGGLGGGGGGFDRSGKRRRRGARAGRPSKLSPADLGGGGASERKKKVPGSGLAADAADVKKPGVRASDARVTADAADVKKPGAKVADARVTTDAADVKKPGVKASDARSAADVADAKKPGAKVPNARAAIGAVTAERAGAKVAPANLAADVVAAAEKPGLMARAAGAVETTAKVGGKVAVPLMLAGAAIETVNGIQDGDAKAIGSGVGSAAGAWAGAETGAALGATIGTFVAGPLGTVVGGAIGGIGGGLAGSEIGSWLGEKLGGLFDRLNAPEEVSKDIAAAANTDNRQIMFAPVFQISGQDAASADALAKKVYDKMYSQMLPGMMANPLAERRGAALTDGGG